MAFMLYDFDSMLRTSGGLRWSQMVSDGLRLLVPILCTVSTEPTRGSVFSGACTALDQTGSVLCFFKSDLKSSKIIFLLSFGPVFDSWHFFGDERSLLVSKV